MKLNAVLMPYSILAINLVFVRSSLTNYEVIGPFRFSSVVAIYVVLYVPI